MNGFWQTWLHIGTGLLCAGVVVAIVGGIYNIGRVNGRDEVYWTRYEKGYEEGKAAVRRRCFNPSRN